MRVTIRYWLVFAAALAAGVLLHFLYDWFPSPVVAVVSPVRESLWEHVKLVYFPLLFAGCVLGRRREITPWLCSLLMVCGSLLLISWFYHVVLRREELVFDLVLYFVMMLVGFLLPRLLWPLAEWPGIGAACAILTVLLGALLAVFSFTQPDGILFADLGDGLRTFFTIPV